MPASHSAFAGVALGLLFAVDPTWTMPAFGLLVGLGIMVLQRGSDLSSDTVIGVFFSAMVAFGLAIVSRDRSLARDLQRFLYGDILTISDGQILCLVGLFVVLMGFQVYGYNHLLYIGLQPQPGQGTPHPRGCLPVSLCRPAGPQLSCLRCRPLACSW